MKSAESRPKASVLIVEDNNLMRTTLESTLLLHNVEVVGTADSAKSAMEIAKLKNPSVALLDLDLGDGPTGIDLAWGLRRTNADIGIVFLTSYSDPRLTGRKLPELPKGALYLDKANIVNSESLIGAITQSLDHKNAKSDENRIATNIDLNDAEIEILKFLWEGKSNSEISKIRKITVKSVETAVSRVAKKCGIQHSSEVNQRILLAKHYQQLTGKIS
jgi:DNA-binding NarL/FixJ family response regulator